MPIYEFICQSCGNEFEQIRAFSDTTVPGCAKCGSEQVVRRVGRPAIHFKGSGWYVTDSKKNGNSASKNVGDTSKGESATESATESPTESKSESKTETKSESSTESKSSSESKSAPAPVAAD